ncbi:D-alanine--D-alanine ligase [anaerobic digester metagenome]
MNSTTTKNIAILAGGNSSEEGISLKSAAQIATWIDTTKYSPFTILVKGVNWVLKHPKLGDIPVDKNDFSVSINGEKLMFHCALIAIHGTPGENGILQAYLELVGVPYTTGGVLSSAATFNKVLCKQMVQETEVNLAKAVFIKKGQSYNVEAIAAKLGLPLFVKPAESGSSYGVSKVKKVEDLEPAIQSAFAEDRQVIIEEFIGGRELTCGVIKTKQQEIVLPVTEIITKNEFFDYEAKYLNQSEEITPAHISPELTQRIQQLSSVIYNTLDCNGIARVDYIVRDNDIYFLEINTVPGMSQASIVPQQVAAHGMTMTEVWSMVLEDTMAR